MNLNFKNYKLNNFRENILNLNYDINQILLLLSVLVLVAFSFYYVFFTAPKYFPVSVVVKINKGETVKMIAKDFQKNNIIKSPILFEIMVRMLRGNKGVMSGDYFFENPKNLFSVVRSVVNGKFGLTPIKVTIFEGTTINEMSNLLAKKFTEFNPKEFRKIAEEGPKEGYLFPDTYYFLPNIKAKDAVFIMEKNFNEKTSELRKKVENSGKSFKDIIIMASLLEEEARTLKSKKMISGILWNRIKIGMPLQVDAVFPYIIGKNTYQVTLKDLKTDSKYNTYIHLGLPIGPISNPGLNSIIAAMEPTKSNYLFYLSDRKGNMHYAVNFEGHKRNRSLYLN